MKYYTSDRCSTLECWYWELEAESTSDLVPSTDDLVFVSRTSCGVRRWRMKAFTVPQWCSSSSQYIYPPTTNVDSHTRTTATNEEGWPTDLADVAINCSCSSVGQIYWLDSVEVHSHRALSERSRRSQLLLRIALTERKAPKLTWQSAMKASMSTRIIIWAFSPTQLQDIVLFGLFTVMIPLVLCHKMANTNQISLL